MRLVCKGAFPAKALLSARMATVFLVGGIADFP
jgi:hypothetical protein